MESFIPDGDVVVVFDQEIRRNPLQHQAIFLSRELPEACVFPYTYFLHHEQYDALKNIPHFSEQSKGILEKDSQNILGMVGPRVRDVILHGRIRMTCLLNTCGGSNQGMRYVLSFMRDVKKRHGATQAFVTFLAASAGAQLFQDSSERYALQEAELMWHVSSHARETGAHRSEWAAIRRFLLRETREAYVAHMKSKLHAAGIKRDNPQNDVEFSARELATWTTILHGMHESCSSLFACLVQQGVCTPSAVRQKKIGSYLKNSFLTEAARGYGFDDIDYKKSMTTPRGASHKSKKRDPHMILMNEIIHKDANERFREFCKGHNLPFVSRKRHL